MINKLTCKIDKIWATLACCRYRALSTVDIRVYFCSSTLHSPELLCESFLKPVVRGICHDTWCDVMTRDVGSWHLICVMKSYYT